MPYSTTLGVFYYHSGTVPYSAREGIFTQRRKNFVCSAALSGDEHSPSTLIHICFAPCVRAVGL